MVASVESNTRLANGFWEIGFGGVDSPGPRQVLDRKNGRTIADDDYCYAVTAHTRGYSHTSKGLQDVELERIEDESGQSIVLTAKFDFGKDGPTDIGIRHRLTLPRAGDWLEEQLTVLHTYGPDEHELTNLRFGFRRIVFDREEYEWRDRADEFQLVPVPHRRRFGHSVDRKLENYAAADLFPQSWEPGGNLPGHGSEAWVWTDGDTSLLIAKYNRDEIEFAVFDGEFTLAKEGTLDVMDAVGSHVPVPVNLCVRFGGVGLYRGDPESGQSLAPRSEQIFGITRLYSVAGGWPAAYGTYRQFLREKGHVTPKGFDPPLHWNELYNLGWRLGDNAPLQTLPQLKQEAATAADIGAEALYIDPTWDTLEGTTIWDNNRLGEQSNFVSFLSDELGLSLSLHLMMHTTNDDEDPRFYLRDIHGETRPFMHREMIYPRYCVCCASDTWKQAKIERVRKLVEDGASFLMFDFCFYGRDTSGISANRNKVEAHCHDPNHGHAVPLTRQGHAEGVLEVIQAVKELHPEVLIEAHDRIAGGMQDYHPLYYQHGVANSFDENWGFEYMWDPYYDLISGQALSLYEYNLAYDIPLYLHIHEGRDSTSMLAFWWYASTIRHLGIGGVSDPKTALYAALKNAVGKYRRLKHHFTQGDFVGIDPYTHVHVLREQQSAVMALFNLTGKDETREIELTLEDLGLDQVGSVAGAELLVSDGTKATIKAEISKMSPLIVGINVEA